MLLSPIFLILSRNHQHVALQELQQLQNGGTLQGSPMETPHQTPMLQDGEPRWGFCSTTACGGKDLLFLCLLSP